VGLRVPIRSEPREKSYGKREEINETIHRALHDPDGDYGQLYRIKPTFSHYVWAWKWVINCCLNAPAGIPSGLVSCAPRISWKRPEVQLMNLKSAGRGPSTSTARSSCFPLNNRKEPLSLWSAFYPRTPMRWEWMTTGDDRVI